MLAYLLLRPEWILSTNGHFSMAGMPKSKLISIILSNDVIYLIPVSEVQLLSQRSVQSVAPSTPCIQACNGC